jgi:hypothetical protein
LLELQISTWQRKLIRDSKSVQSTAPDTNDDINQVFGLTLEQRQTQFAHTSGYAHLQRDGNTQFESVLTGGPNYDHLEDPFSATKPIAVSTDGYSMPRRAPEARSKGPYSEVALEPVALRLEPVIDAFQEDDPFSPARSAVFEDAPWSASPADTMAPAYESAFDAPFASPDVSDTAFDESNF